jgi:hypothetical protein
MEFTLHHNAAFGYDTHPQGILLRDNSLISSLLSMKKISLDPPRDSCYTQQSYVSLIGIAHQIVRLMVSRLWSPQREL